MLTRKTSSKLDNRFKDTRERILQQAKFAYYAGGYAGINLQELASSVGITKPALFNHFKNKQQLFFEVLLEICKDHEITFQEAIDKAIDIRSQLYNVLLTTAQHPFYDPMQFLAEEIKILDAEQRSVVESSFAQANLPIAKALESAFELGQLRKHNPRLAIMTFRTLMMLLPSPGNPITRNVSEEQIESYINELLDLFLYGLSSK